MLLEIEHARVTHSRISRAAMMLADKIGALGLALAEYDAGEHLDRSEGPCPMAFRAKKVVLAEAELEALLGALFRR